MEPTLSSETSAFKLQTPGKFPKEHRLHSKHGESLKTTIINLTENIHLWYKSNKCVKNVLNQF